MEREGGSGNETTSVEGREASKLHRKGREIILIQPNKRTVRQSDYPTHVLPLRPPPRDSPCPCLEQNTSPMHTRSLKVPPSTLFTNVFLDDFVFLPDTNLMEDKAIPFQQNPGRNMKENSAILVFYYHRQSKED